MPHSGLDRGRGGSHHLDLQPPSHGSRHAGCPPHRRHAAAPTRGCPPGYRTTKLEPRPRSAVRAVRDLHIRAVPLGARTGEATAHWECDSSSVLPSARRSRVPGTSAMRVLRPTRQADPARASRECGASEAGGRPRALCLRAMRPTLHGDLRGGTTFDRPGATKPARERHVRVYRNSAVRARLRRPRESCDLCDHDGEGGSLPARRRGSRRRR